MKGENEVWQSDLRQHAMRPALPLHGPADFLQCGKDFARLAGATGSRGDNEQIATLRDLLAMLYSIGKRA